MLFQFNTSTLFLTRSSRDVCFSLPVFPRLPRYRDFINLLKYDVMKCVALLCKISALFIEVCNMLSIPRYCFQKHSCYIALLHTTSKFWCLSRLLFVTKYYQQHFSQHRRQAKCTAVPLQIVELSNSHITWLLVDNKSKTPLLNRQNRIETTVSTHIRKRQHKRLRIASVSSNIFEAVVANKAYPT